MIVCHCQSISDHDIRAAVDWGFGHLADKSRADGVIGLFDKLGARRYGLLNAKPASKAE